MNSPEHSFPRPHASPQRLAGARWEATGATVLALGGG